MPSWRTPQGQTRPPPHPVAAEESWLCMRDKMSSTMNICLQPVTKLRLFSASIILSEPLVKLPVLFYTQPAQTQSKNPKPAD